VPLDVIGLDVPAVTTLYQSKLVLVRPEATQLACRIRTPDARALIDVVRGAKAWANLDPMHDAAGGHGPPPRADKS